MRGASRPHPHLPSPYAAAALTHVAGLAQGGLLDPSLPVTLSFHPDRRASPDRNGIGVLAALAHDGVYRSQHETGTSNGGLTAHPGGDRWRWEQRIFGGAYDDAPVSERPKYGALDHRGTGLGGAPRFGSSFFRLGPHVLERTTFCFPDSVFEPADLATAQAFSLADLADTAVLTGRLDPLDGYVEAHVHGVVDLTADVEALVLDPCYRDTAVADEAVALPCPVEWHHGFRLDVETLGEHPAYRGVEVVDLGRRIAVDGWLDAAVIGRAVATGDHDPQRLKQVWHHVARFGAQPLP